MKKCTACGTEPFDKCFGVGYQIGHGEYSPYARVNRARKTFFDTDFNIDYERACLLTKGYKENKSAPQIIKVARALENVLENVKINIYPEELVVGEIAAPNKYAPIYPEFSYAWIMDEMENSPFEDREFDQYNIDDKAKDELRSIKDFWEGNTVADAIENRMSFDEKKGSEMGKGMYLLNLYHYAGVGHVNSCIRSSTAQRSTTTATTTIMPMNSPATLSTATAATSRAGRTRAEAPSRRASTESRPTSVSAFCAGRRSTGDTAWSRFPTIWVLCIRKRRPMTYAARPRWLIPLRRQTIPEQRTAHC